LKIPRRIKALLFFGVLFVLPLGLYFGESWFTGLFENPSTLGVVVLGAAFVNASIVLPAPIITAPLLVKIAVYQGVWLTALAYAIGSAFGESTGWWIGRTGRQEIPALDRFGFHQRMERYMRGNWGGLALFLLSFCPIPVLFPFDVGGLIAGSIRYPYWKFYFATCAGRFLKYLLFLAMWDRIVNLEGLAPKIGIGIFLALVVIVFLWWYRKKLQAFWTTIRLGFGSKGAD